MRIQSNFIYQTTILFSISLFISILQFILVSTTHSTSNVFLSINNLLSMFIGYLLFTLIYLAPNPVQTWLPKIFFLSTWTLLLIFWLDHFFISHHLVFGIINGNLIANGIVMMTLSTVILNSKLHRGQQLSVLVSLVMTGMRSAIIIYYTCLCIYLCIHHRDKNSTIILILISFIICTLLFPLLPFITRPNYQSSNLLMFSNNLAHTSWNHYVPIKITQVSTKEKSSIMNIQGDLATPPLPFTLLIAQPVITKPHSHYIVSTYLKAKEPLTIILTNNLGGRVSCNITTEWHRCIVPKTYSGDSENGKFKIFLTGDNTSFDFYIWGSQFEQTDFNQPTEVNITNDSVLDKLTFRLNLENFSLSKIRKDIAARQNIYTTAWEIFKSNPLIGIGTGNFKRYIMDNHLNIQPIPNHAHNLFLHLLSENGILGFIAWLISFIGLFLIPNPSEKKLQILPLIFSLILFNLIDYMYYNGLSFFPYWITLGILLR